MLLPFTALMRYHVLADTDLPPHAVRQAPPETFATTVTFDPTRAMPRRRALVDVLERRLALQIAVFEAVAPRTSAGDATETNEEASRADRIAVTMTVARGRRIVRADSNTTDLALDGPKASTPVLAGTITLWSQSTPAL